MSFEKIAVYFIIVIGLHAPAAYPSMCSALIQSNHKWVFAPNLTENRNLLGFDIAESGGVTHYIATIYTSRSSEAGSGFRQLKETSEFYSDSVRIYRKEGSAKILEKKIEIPDLIIVREIFPIDSGGSAPRGAVVTDSGVTIVNLRDAVIEMQYEYSDKSTVNQLRDVYPSGDLALELKKPEITFIGSPLPSSVQITTFVGVQRVTRLLDLIPFSKSP